jgi:hypothetical protein
MNWEEYEKFCLILRYPGNSGKFSVPGRPVVSVVGFMII